MYGFLMCRDIQLPLVMPGTRKMSLIFFLFSLDIISHRQFYCYSSRWVFMKKITEAVNILSLNYKIHLVLWQSWQFCSTKIYTTSENLKMFILLYYNKLQIWQTRNLWRCGNLSPSTTFIQERFCNQSTDSTSGSIVSECRLGKLSCGVYF